MKDMIIVQALENGYWEIQVLMQQGRKQVRRGKKCRV